MGDGAVEVLHGINLEVPAGELTMLVGPSGCGKTTLISIIAGILSPTSGEVETCGKPLTRMSDAEKVAFRRSWHCRPRYRHPGCDQRNGCVLRGGQRRQKIVLLEDETDVAARSR
jgi:energy-coupling factor transporter ATP-binding protein EcfA2